MKDEKSINSLVNTIDKCISLIKYVRFYDESLDDVYQLENSMRVSIESLKKASVGSLEQFNADIEKLKKIADKRFYKIGVLDIETELKTFIRSIIMRLKSKIDINESLERYLDSIIIIGSVNFDEKTKSIVICNDPFILDEIASLIYDAIKNNSKPFSIKGNEEKSNSFWITCEIIHSYVLISIYNSTSKETSAIRVDINSKIRVGKQYLNRFNISVEYPEPSDDEFCGTDENVFKTVIKYPYFN